MAEEGFDKLKKALDRAAAELADEINHMLDNRLWYGAAGEKNIKMVVELMAKAPKIFNAFYKSGKYENTGNETKKEKKYVPVQEQKLAEKGALRRGNITKPN